MTLSAPARHVGWAILEWKPERAEPIPALRATTSIIAIIAASLIFGIDAHIIAPTIMGAWSGGMTLIVHDVRPRPTLPLLAGIAIAVALYLGGSSAHFPVTTIVVSMAWAWLMAYIGSLGAAVGAVATSCGVALVLAPAITTEISPATAAIAAIIGGATQVLAALLPPWRRHFPERTALAAAYRALAEDSRRRANTMNIPLPNEELIDLQQVVGARRVVPQSLTEAMSHLYELRAAIIAVGAARARLVNDHPMAARHISQVLRSTAKALDTMADRVKRTRSTSHGWELQLAEAVDAASPALGYADKADTDPHENGDTPIPHAIAGHEIRRLQRALHWSSRLAERVAAGNQHATDVVSRRVRVRTRVSEDWSTLRTYLDLSSPAMRHATRSAVVIAVATSITILWPYDHSHWVSLTAWITLKSDFASTIGRGVQRILGTAIGATIAGSLSEITADDPFWTAVAVIGFAIAGYMTMPVSFFIFSGFVAGFAVFQIDLAGASPVAAAWDRGIATLIGGALALAFFALWPTWQTQRLPDLLADLVGAYGRYARIILSAQATSRQLDEDRLRETVDDIRLSRSQLSAAIEQASVEPVKYRPFSSDVVDAEQALARGARALIVLEGTARHATDNGELPQLIEFASAIGDAYERLEKHIRSGEKPISLDLEAEMAALDDALSEGTPESRRRRRVLDWETGVLVESLDDTVLIVNGWHDEEPR